MINIIDELNKIVTKIKELSFINYAEYYPVFKIGNRFDAVMIKIGNSESIEENSDNLRVKVPISFIYINKSKRNKINELISNFNTLAETINTNRKLSNFLSFQFEYLDFGNDNFSNFDSQNPQTGNYENLAVKSVNCLIEYCIKQ